MSKYNRSFKCAIAKQCLNDTSSRALSKQHNISSRQIRYWAQVYSIHGDDAFLPTHHASSVETKLAALQLMWTNDWSITHTSAILNLSSPSTLWTWLKQYQEHGLQGLESQPRGRASAMKMKPRHTVKSDDEKTIKELREEIADLKAENAVLKKLEELAQQQRRQTKPKPPLR